jgi:tetratricopeptide (TPR) repeat protein
MKTPMLAPDPATALAEANRLLLGGDAAGALAAYEALCARWPGCVEAEAHRGVALHQLGRLEPALAAYDAALALLPSFADAWANRGIALMQLGRLDAALASHERALAVQSGHVQAGYGRAVALQLLGHMAPAVAAYDAVLAVQPNHAAAQANRAVALAALGRRAEALAGYDAALALAPQDAESWSNRADTLRALGRPEEAAASCERALALRPDLPEAWLHRGQALMDLGALPAALECLGHAKALRPEFAEAWNSEGAALERLHRSADALVSLDRALALAPGNVPAWCNRAASLLSLRQEAAALAATDRAVALRPDDPTPYHNRAVALLALHRDAEALAAAERALHLDPRDGQGAANRGLALEALGRHAEALESFRLAHALRPAEAELEFAYGLALLLRGELAPGFRHYEARLRSHNRRISRLFPQPAWDGQRPLAGRRLFLHWEQGFGDTIQMLRYLPGLAGQGAGITVSVPDALLPAVRDALGGIAVIGGQAPAPAFDEHAPLLSLPHLCGTTLASIPPVLPLAPEAGRRAAWAARLGPRRGPRIGLAWAGDPGHANDRNRSMPFATLAPLLTRQADWIAVQKAMPEAERAALGRVRWFGPALTDFAATAALLTGLDLLITVDTGVAHLAGSLGLPVWLMLPYVPDWRWLLERGDSPWYPGMRLFRQPGRGDWAGVVAAIRAALEAV